MSLREIADSSLVRTTLQAVITVIVGGIATGVAGLWVTQSAHNRLMLNLEGRATSLEASRAEQAGRIQAQQTEINDVSRRVTVLETRGPLDQSLTGSQITELRNLLAQLGHDVRGLSDRLDRIRYEPDAPMRRGAQ